MKLTIKLVSATLISYVWLSKAKANDKVFDVGTVKETKEEHHPHRSLQLQLNQRWKDRIGDVVVVPYTIAPTFSANDVALIDSSVTDLGDRSAVVKFVRRTNQRAYIVVRNDADGCFSNIGRIPSGTSQILNLGQGCLYAGTIQHEFLHALGMWHEQSRTDRDQFIEVNLENVPERHRHNFDIKTGSLNLETLYDYESLMHYGSTSFSTFKNVPVITTMNGAPIGQREGPSPTDIIELQLIYQCLSGPRSLSSYNSNLCTSDCKCWEGAVGCNGNNAACRGDLGCVNNVCVKGGTTEGSGGCSDVPSWWVDSDGDSCQAYATNGWCIEYGNDFANDGKTANQACCACGGGSNSGNIFINLKNTESPDLCIDVKGGSTTDGAAVVHYPCNGGSSQKWYWDANYYIRSALDINKCLVGEYGSSERGTNLMINTCFPNDDRFKWVYYTDFSISPLNDDSQCVVPSLGEQLDGVLVMQLFDCNNAANQQWRGYQPTSRERVLQTAICADTPLGWYNSFGDNCEWYSEDTNCEDYGSGLSNFGKTANQACCLCGGGSTAIASDVADFPAVDNTNNCWDTINGWVDSVGDGCNWYSQGDNCQYYGNDFADPTAGRIAQEVCCACGGGSSTPTNDIPSEDTPGCSDTPSRWVDDNNDGCDFYAIGDNCEKYGDQFANYGKTANEVCCVCRASSTATKSPSAASTPTTSSSATSPPSGLFNLAVYCALALLVANKALW